LHTPAPEEARQGSRSRAEHLYALVIDLVSEGLCELVCGLVNLVAIGALETNQAETSKGRVRENFSLMAFTCVEGLVVSELLEREVLWMVGLNEDSSSDLASSCSSCELSQQREAALCSTEIRHHQDVVCTDNNGEEYIRKVVSFGDDLRAYQHSRLPFSESF